MGVVAIPFAFAVMAAVETGVLAIMLLLKVQRRMSGQSLRLA
jgi:hypothetical protein